MPEGWPEVPHEARAEAALTGRTHAFGDEDQTYFAVPRAHRYDEVVAQPDVRKPHEAVARLRQLLRP